MHLWRSKTVLAVTMPHLHSANSSLNCSLVIPGDVSEDNRATRSRTFDSVNCGGSRTWIVAAKLIMTLASDWQQLLENLLEPCRLALPETFLCALEFSHTPLSGGGTSEAFTNIRQYFYKEEHNLQINLEVGNIHLVLVVVNKTLKWELWWWLLC